MAATAIMHAGSDDQKRALLPDHGVRRGHRNAGQRRSLAAGWASRPDPHARRTKAGDGYTLTGTKSYVLDGMTAGRIGHRRERARWPAGAFFTTSADGHAACIASAALKSMDPTRKLARIDFGMRAPVELLGDAVAHGAEAYAQTMDVMLVPASPMK